MATLRQIIYDVKEIFNSYSDDALLSEEHIAFLINTKRAFYLKQYLSQLKLEFKGNILEDSIDFFKNYEFEKIKDLIIIEDEMSPKEKKRIKTIIIETK